MWRGIRPVLSRDGPAVAALLAFLLLYLLPFMLRNSALFQIGNDFQSLYSNYATYSVDAMRAGFTPWWNPNEACGYPFYSNPFTAFFYPGRLLYFMLAAGAPQYSWYHHQVYMVIGIGVFALGLYAWLRGRGVEPPAALVAAGVIAISFRIADIYRFPNAIHAAAWMPWILYAYDRWLDRAIGRGFVLGLVAVLCLCTAGYPYYSIYAVVLVASYVALRITEGIPLRRALLAFVTIIAPAACLLLPYYSSMSRMLGLTADRGGADYRYSTAHLWSHLDLLGGLIFPPSAMSEGWLYCGLVPLLIVLVWAAIRKPASGAFLWITGLTFFVQLMATGARSFLFPALWSFVPGVESLRIWPRMTIILLLPMALLIALAYEGITSARVPDRLLQRSAWRVALVILALQVLLWTTATFSEYYTLYFQGMMPVSFVMSTLVAAVFLTVWAFYRGKANLAWAVVALMVTASDIGVYGLQLWRHDVGSEPPSKSLDLPGYYRRFFTTPRPDALGMILPYVPTSGVHFNWYYKSYVTFVEQYSKKNGFAEFTGSLGRKLFVSPTLDAEPEHFEQWWHDLGAFEAAAGASAVPNAPYNGNELRLSYQTAHPGYLIFVDNNDPEWHASVNGTAVPVASAFGTFKAVRIPAGRGTVTFQYKPWLQYKSISVLGLLMAIGIMVVMMRRKRVTTSS